jgi:hypothetical protein
VNYWAIVGVLLSVVSTGASVGIYFVVSSVKVAILELELRETVARAVALKEVQAWAEARFARRGVAS